jgi:hypothetical protein
MEISTAVPILPMPALSMGAIQHSMIRRPFTLSRGCAPARSVVLIAAAASAASPHAAGRVSVAVSVAAGSVVAASTVVAAGSMAEVDVDEAAKAKHKTH